MINILSRIQLEYYAENCTTIDKTVKALNFVLIKAGLWQFLIGK